MFKSYKPKGDRVQAVQVTNETIADIAQHFMGRVITETKLVAGIEKMFFAGVDIPTLDGVRSVEKDSWIVRTTSGLRFFTNDEFAQAYEPSKVTNTRS